MRNRQGVVRAGGLVLVSGALVAAASLSSTSLELATPNERAGLVEASDVLVKEATLLCPGQSREGGQGLRDVPGVVRAAVSAPPSGLLDRSGGSSPGSSGGELALRTIPGGSTLSTSNDRGRAASASLRAAVSLDAVSAEGAGALAPGLVAAQTWLHTGDDDRGLAVTPCTLPGSDLWLVGGGGGPSRTERLVLTNPGANAISVRLDVLGARGPAAGAAARSVSIAPRSRTVVSLDALAPDEPSPVVHVVATGGVVTGVLVDSWIDGATGRGTDDVTRSASPGTDLVIPGVDVAGAALVRLANPGTAEALVQVRLLTSGGAAQVDALRAIRVPAGSTVDVPLAAVAKGLNGLRVLSDRPVTAGAWVDRRAGSGEDRMGDFAWAPATSPLRGLGGFVLPLPEAAGPRLTGVLALAAGEAGATVKVTTMAGGTPVATTITLKPDSSAAVQLGSADRVWVTPAAGEVHAAVVVAGADADGPLYSVAAVQGAPVTASSVPVRQVAN